MTTLAASLPAAPTVDTDARHLAAAASGDLDAFNALVLSHQDYLYGVAIWASGDATLAEDALQDGLIRAYARATLYRGEGPVRAWLARIVINACRDAQRWQRRRHLEPLPMGAFVAADHDGDPHRTLLRRERSRVLTEALGKLGFDQRVALVLYAVYGLEYEEIVLATAAPLGTVKSRIHRARLALRSLVADRRDLFVES